MNEEVGKGPRPRWDPCEVLELPHPVGAYIDGRWVLPRTNETFRVEDPADLCEIAVVTAADDTVVEYAVESAQTAFRSKWASISPRARGQVLAGIAIEIRRQAEVLSYLETMDTGKPVSQARSDVETSAQYFDYYAGAADKITGDTLPEAEELVAYSVREPYGVVAHITPWNSPMSQMCRGVAACLAVGNTAVVKPSELAPLSTLVMARLFVQCGLPPGVCNVVPGLGPTTGQAVVSHPLVRHVTFTGSIATGQEVLRAAATNITPCTLELGGKSPTIVMADANLRAAAHAGAMAVVRNSGQSCMATTRMLVERPVLEEFVAHLGAEVAGLTMGHGLDDPDLGPLVSAGQRLRVLEYLRSAERAGARVAARSVKVTLPLGHFVEAAVLVDVTSDMPVAREEIFGPVQAVLCFDSLEEAVTLANDSEYGLSAGVFTTSLSAAHYLAKRLEAGQVHVNRYQVGGVALPFGGYKQSGIGREKGLEALHHYTQLKTVVVAVDGG